MTPYSFDLSGDALAEAMTRYKPGQLGAAPTLGNPQAMQAQEQQSLAQLLEAYKNAQADQQRGMDMMAPEYVQNSGAMGAAAMLAEAFAGRKIRQRGTAEAEKYAGLASAEQTRQAALAAIEAQRVKLADEKRKWGREDSRDAAKADREMKLAQLRIDEATKRAGMSASARIQAAKIAAGGQGGYRLMSDDEEQAAGLPQQGVYQVDPKGSVKPIVKPAQAQNLTGELRMKLGMLNAAEAAAKKYEQAVLPSGGGFNESALFLGPAGGQIEEAINNVLRVESGAAVPETEVDSGVRRYGASVFNQERTARANLKQLYDKIDILRSELTGAPRTPEPSDAGSADGFKVLRVRPKASQ